MKKIALVTGASAGIGRASAKALLEYGCAVIGMGTREGETEPLGGEFTYVSGSIAEAADRERFVKTALDKYGRIDILVNAAGVAPKVRADVLTMSEESYDRVMGINTKGTLFLTQLAANEMIKNEGDSKGTIVNISSISAYTSSPNRGEYCISKAGVSMITKLFADRLSGEGITVNEICPGIIATGMTEAVKEKYDTLIADGLIPLGRWGTPDDVGRAVAALCDGTFGYTTGASLIVDGGMHIRSL